MLNDVPMHIGQSNVTPAEAVDQLLVIDPEFQDRNRAVINAEKAIKDYKHNIQSINKTSPKN